MFESGGNSFYGIAKANQRAANAYLESAEEWRAHAAKLQIRIDELEFALLVKKAALAGNAARIDGFIAAHPDSAERAQVATLKDGSLVSVSMRRWQKAFDAFLIAAGIRDPASHRKS